MSALNVYEVRENTFSLREPLFGCGWCWRSDKAQRWRDVLRGYGLSHTIVYCQGGRRGAPHRWLLRGYSIEGAYGE